MTFKYKLSKRLALMKAASLAAACATAACERQPTDPALAILSVTQVTTSPSDITIDPEATRAFRAFGRTLSGDSVGVPVTWSASGGSITGSGVYTAGPTPGDFTVTATVTGTHTVGTSRIKNRGSVSRVVMTPASFALMPAQTGQFLIYGLRQNGDSVALAADFSATGGTISAFGLFTAGTSAGTYRVIARQQGGTLADTSLVTINTGSPVPVATVVVSPSAVTLAPGATRQLSAVTRDAQGNTLSGRALIWTSDNQAVGTVSATGLVSAISAGTATISATSEGKTGGSAATVQATVHSGFYVASNGSSSGNGSMTAPWDLQTALNHPAAVHPGDTIWVRGGTYSGQFTSRLNGTAAAPIIVRQYPGERATLDGGTGGPTLTTGGSYAWFWGLEVTSSSPSASKSAVSNYNSLGIKFINLVMHDAGGSGFSSFSANGARQTEIHGSLSYNNGTHFNLDHGMYLQNVAANGTFVVTDNIVFNNEAFGIHIYGQPGESISGFRVEGNVSFGTGSISVPVNRGNDILIGGSTPSSGIVARNNYTYWNVAPPSDPGRWSINLGYLGGVQNGDVVVENNYVVGGLYLAQWSSALVRGNLLYDYGGPMVTLESGWSGHTWDTNQFYGVATLPVWTAFPNGATGFGTWKSQTGFSNPGGYSGSGTPPNLVVVRPNQYEAGRANIIVYNWALQGAVSADLTGILRPGDAYVVKNVQDFFGAPAASGSYAGGAVPLPMAGIAPAAPIGRSYSAPAVTGPIFQVFVVTKTN